MGLIDSLRTFLNPPIERAATVYPPHGPGIDDWWPYVNFDSNLYSLGGLFQTAPGGRTEEIAGGYAGLAGGAYKANGIVFACIATRLQVFSQARFQFQRLRSGRPDDLFGTAALGILETPWPGGTTGDLLSRMLLHADLGGNAYITRRPGGLRLLRPDWVGIVVGTNAPEGSSYDLDAEVLGYVYYPGGRGSGEQPVGLLREDVAHFAPLPDPEASYRGMSWLSPIIREVQGDRAATEHKLRFFENGATPNLVVTRKDAPDRERFDQWKDMIEAGHRGLANAYKTLYLTAGADADVVGKDLQQLEFKATQGAGETRIAAAAGVHPVIVGLSEGLQGSSLNAGNFNSARRLVADKTMWHLWSNAAGTLESIVAPPSDARLWVDPRDIPFLREDRKDAAEIQDIKARTIRTLTDGGYEPTSVIAAVENEDMNLLKWTGLVSVQLQPPGSLSEPTNGSAPNAVVGTPG